MAAHDGAAIGQSHVGSVWRSVSVQRSGDTVEGLCDFRKFADKGFARDAVGMLIDAMEHALAPCGWCFVEEQAHPDFVVVPARQGRVPSTDVQEQVALCHERLGRDEAAQNMIGEGG